MTKTVAAFDFDGTISDRDSLLPFLRRYFGFFSSKKGFHCLPDLCAYFFRMITNSELKRRVLRVYFQGVSQEEINSFTRDYAENYLSDYIRSKALDRLNWHKEQGHECVIVSASMELYLRPWGLKVGFDDILGTKLDFSKSPPLMLKNCYGPEKVIRLKEKYGKHKNYTLYAYGDSKGDRELLKYADYPNYRIF